MSPSATPVMPENRIDAPILTWARPPGIQPNSTFANATSRSVIRLSLMISPRQDEQRDRHQHEDVDALEDPFGQNRKKGRLAAGGKPDERRDRHRPGDRQPGEQEKQERRQE